MCCKPNYLGGIVCAQPHVANVIYECPPNGKNLNHSKLEKNLDKAVLDIIICRSLTSNTFQYFTHLHALICSKPHLFKTQQDRLCFLTVASAARKTIKSEALLYKLYRVFVKIFSTYS